MKTKSNILIFSAGLVSLSFGLATFGYFVVPKIRKEMQLKKLMNDSIIFEIPRLQIRVPVLEGTDKETLSVAAGHFIGTGSVGYGNYCIAGHNSTLYAEIFNHLDEVKIGDELYLIDNDYKRTRYTYIVTAYTTVTPQSTEILDDCGDNRLTVVSCTDDGKLRQVVVSILQ